MKKRARPRTEAEQRLYLEGQIAGLRLILAEILTEIDPKGDLQKRVRDRLVLRRQKLSERFVNPPRPLVDGTLGVFDAFVHQTDLERSS